MKSLNCITKFFCLFILAGCTPDVPEKMRLAFDDDGRFKIVQLTDIHWVHGSDKTARSAELIKSILAAEKPDMAVITGDAVWRLPNREPWADLTAIFEAAQTPFAIVFGNHDDEENTAITRSEIIEIFRRSPYFVGEKGPADIHGVSNYVVPVYASKGNSIAALLYCFDSNTYSGNPLYSGYQPIYFSQIAWYHAQSQQYTAANAGEPVPALAFFHIPLQEYHNVATRIGHRSAARGNVGPSYNTGLFGTFIDRGDVMGAFVGHIHGNDFIGIEKGIALAYGRVTGWDAGGNLERGARIIELYEGERVFDTWIRTEHGVEPTYNFPTGITSGDDTLAILPAKLVKTAEHGVNYTYYEGRFPSAAEIDPAAKLSSGAMKNISIDGAKAKFFFAYEFRTMIKVPDTGIYSFYTSSDDGSQLYIDGQLVTQKIGAAVARVDGKVALEAGFHEMRLLYQQWDGGKAYSAGYQSRNVRDHRFRDDELYLPQQ